MKIKPESVTIVKFSGGFVAHVRYADPHLDVDISHENKNKLYLKVDKYFLSTE